MAKTLTASKARQMLKDGTAHGRPLTKAQRGYFGRLVGQARAKGRKV